jgi:hypothetical protein
MATFQEAWKTNVDSIARHRNAQRALLVTPSDEETKAYEKLKKLSGTYIRLVRDSRKPRRTMRACRRVLAAMRNYLEQFAPHADIK